MKQFLAAVLLVLTLNSAQAADRPNILLMMVDDLGFSDFGCYGSEIETPHIDKLAKHGLRMSQFYNTAKCHSSRICLITGLYCNQAGNEKLTRATTIAKVLGNNGYFTSMTGKWHLKKEPTDFGFQRYWGHLSGATDFFVGDDTFRLNGKVWNDFDKDFYTTDANIDYSMKFLDEAISSKKPFFHYIAFNAPHYPLQAPKEDIKKYLGKYDVGWEEIRQRRLKKQKSLGLFKDNMKLPPLPDHVSKWSELSEHEKEFESFRMSIFAAMVDRVDQNIGKLIAYLKKKGKYENTLIMLCSDNGACPFERSKNIDIPPWKGNSYYLYDASWATVGNTPLKHYKQTQHEGGISSPFIAHWPGKIKNPGTWERSQGHLIDVMATCLELANASYPESDQIEPLQGKSLVPLFKGEKRRGHDELYFQFSSCRALRKGDWKVVSFYLHKWELYNIANDRQEQHDLSDKHPEIVKSMTDRWDEIAIEKDKLSKRQRKAVKQQPTTNNNKTWHKPGIAKDWKMPAF